MSIRQIITQRGLKNSFVAKQLGVSRQMLNNYARGSAMVPGHLVLRLAAVLGITLTEAAQYADPAVAELVKHARADR